MKEKPPNCWASTTTPTATAEKNYTKNERWVPEKVNEVKPLSILPDNQAFYKCLTCRLPDVTLIRRNKPLIFSSFADTLISLLDAFAYIFFERFIRFIDIKTVAV